MMCDDQELVKSILEGNINSFNLIIQKYHKEISRFVYGMLRNNEDAKDVTQEVFIAVYNKLYTFKGNSKLSNWLYQVARNKCIDFLRRHRKVVQICLEDSWSAVSKELSPEACFEMKETKGELEMFIKSLDQIDRQIILLKSVNENLRFSDIAEILKVNESTVKSKYYRLWDKYKSYIKAQEKRCII